ncbi:hypothetical protein RHSIM_Rhsim10G0155500 [Rhododendron simsii]|uniref:Uncharacterized protein n=1 Tax=Rhododendron simsii TaxID=118357 RepID=A0A834LD47_RHOSS|nr:hypothetical protein RHSIM_Rhsim10G0155500 [Rhododendron simsii]
MSQLWPFWTVFWMGLGLRLQLADIAMLVAEEYERRVKNARKIGGENEEIDMFSSVSVLARGVEWSSWINRNLGEEKMELVKKAMEPRSQIGVAAINGFFSA